MITIEKDNQIILAKSKYEEALLSLYVQQYNLELDNTNKEKLVKFNTYLTLFENHCINNKEHYKQIIKILSQFYVKKIYIFMDRIDFIIEKGLKKESNWDRYIIDNDQSVLFISLNTEKYNIEFINFISNLFMKKFNIKKLLSVISYAVSEENYALDFAVIEYDSFDEEKYIRAIEGDFANYWNSYSK